VQVGKRGDLTVLDIEHPNELALAVGQSVVSDVVIGGQVILSRAGGLTKPAK
jgi:imidazolonepropionase-like amidohydrolase